MAGCCVPEEGQGTLLRRYEEALMLVNEYLLVLDTTRGTRPLQRKALSLVADVLDDIAERR